MNDLEGERGTAAAIERLPLAERESVVKLHRLASLVQEAHEQAPEVMKVPHEWNLITDEEEFNSIYYSPQTGTFIDWPDPITYTKASRDIKYSPFSRGGFKTSREEGIINFEIAHYFTNRNTRYKELNPRYTPPEVVARLSPWVARAQEIAYTPLTAQELAALPVVLAQDFERVTATRITQAQEKWIKDNPKDYFLEGRLREFIQMLHTSADELDFDRSAIFEFATAHAPEALAYLQSEFDRIFKPEPLLYFTFNARSDLADRRRFLDDLIDDVEQWGELSKVDTSESVARLQERRKKA